MGTTEIIFILLIYLLLFGAKGMPSLARTLGSAVRQFRTATDEIQREILSTTDATTPRPRPQPRPTNAPASGEAERPEATGKSAASGSNATTSETPPTTESPSA